MRNLVLSLFVLTLLALAAGCSHDSSAISGVSGGEADKLGAAHSRFESSEDPPITAATHYAAGQFAETQSRPDMAMEQYRAALAMDPKYQRAQYRLAVLLAQAKDYSQAIATFKQYIEVTGRDATAYADLGFCYELAGRCDEAETAYQQGLVIEPRNEHCCVNYGLMLARANRVNEAIIHLQAVLAPAQVHYNLGSIYEMQNKREAAKMEYRKALTLDPQTPHAKDRLAGLE